tara:strand:- start:656 stop:949 length:294 start_codon:yes stop_codon:yes gene_type:complete
MDGIVNIPDLLDYMKKEGLVLVKEKDIIPSRLQERYLRKKSLTFKEISDANIWGEIGKSRVEAIAQDLLPHEKFKSGNKWKVHRSAVERIAKNRGTL